ACRGNHGERNLVRVGRSDVGRHGGEDKTAGGEEQRECAPPSTQVQVTARKQGKAMQSRTLVHHGSSFWLFRILVRHASPPWAFRMGVPMSLAISASNFGWSIGNLLISTLYPVAIIT